MVAYCQRYCSYASHEVYGCRAMLYGTVQFIALHIVPCFRHAEALAAFTYALFIYIFAVAAI
jgi:hypothetical protein